jgi:hypothetical protein
MPAIDWTNPQIQAAAIAAVIAAVVAVIIAVPGVVVSLRALRLARRQYELAMQERTAVYRQPHYEAAVKLALEVKEALDDFLSNAVGQITLEQSAAFVRGGRKGHEPLDEDARMRLRDSVMPQLQRLYGATGRAGVIFDTETLQALGRVNAVFVAITAFGSARGSADHDLAESVDPAMPLAETGQVAVEALRTELHSGQMSAELRERMTWRGPTVTPPGQ